MYCGYSDDEAACLQTAIDLLERSDAYAVTEPRLARQYARQAYGLGQRSSRLLHSIAQERIRMIVQASDQYRMKTILDAAQLPKGARLRHGKKAGFMILFLFAASFVTATPVGEPPDPRVTLATRIINAPL